MSFFIVLCISLTIPFLIFTSRYETNILLETHNMSTKPISIKLVNYDINLR